MKYTYRFNILLWLIFVGHIVMAGKDKPEYQAFSIPDELKDNADAVIRNATSIHNISNSSTIEVHRIMAVTILSRNGDNFGELVLKYNDDREKITKLEANLYDAFGQHIRKIRKDEIKDFTDFSQYSLFDDYRIRYLQMRNNKYPYTVEFEYKVTINGFINIPTWIIQPDEKVSVEKSTYVFYLPENYTLKYFQANIDIEPIIKTSKKGKEYFFIAKNIPAKEDEYFDPPFQNVYPIIFFSPLCFEYYDLKGNTESWKQLGQFYYNLNNNRDTFNEIARKDIRDIVKGSTLKHEKIRRLYKYLQENTRYVSIQLGLGGSQCMEAQVVHDKKYGDCKGLSNYMKAMLNLCGIDSRLVLVTGGMFYDDINTTFVSDQFNHYILMVPLEKDSIWIECTSKTSPLGYLGRFTSNRHALVLDKDGGHLMKTPSRKSNDNTCITKGNVYLEVNGNGQIVAKTLCSGFQFERPANIRFENDLKQTEGWLSDLIDCSSYDIEEYKFGEINDSLPQIDIEYTFNIRKLLSKTGTTAFLTPSLIHKQSKYSTYKIDRKQDVFFNYPFLDIDSLCFQIPGNYEFKSTDYYPKEYNTEFGNYKVECSYDAENNSLNFVRRFELFSFYKPAESYIEFIGFLNNISRAGRNRIVFMEKQL